jgi:hypothetical protein
MLLLTSTTPASGCCVGVYKTKPPTHPKNIDTCPAPLDSAKKSNFNTCTAGTKCYVLHGDCPNGIEYMSYCWTSASAMIAKATRESGNTIVWTDVSSAASVRPSMVFLIIASLGMLLLRGGVA